MSEHHPREILKDEHAILHGQLAQANYYNRPENVSYQQAQAFDHIQGSVHYSTLHSSAYESLDNAGALINYQHAFQPLDYNPQNQHHSFSGAHPSIMHAPTRFFASNIPEKPWVDEISTSYIPVGNESFDWTPSDARSYSWATDTPFTNPTEPVAHTNIPTTLPIDQYRSFENAASEGDIAQRFVSDTMLRLPLQQTMSTRPALTALKVRNEKFKREVSALLYDKADHNVHKATRVSKTKRTEKVDTSIKQEACWRCKRYRKACIGKDICKECSTADFRVWPSEIGCRRGAMESFVEKIMPLHSISVLRDLRVGVLRTSNWRKALYQPDTVSPSPNGTNSAGRWDLLKQRVRSTMVFGADFSALADILAAYENAQKTEIPIWTQSIILLSSTCDFYHFFVESSNTDIQLPQLVDATIKFRKSLARTWDMFLKLCLSGRRENWFSAFLAVILGICSMVILTDSIPSMPMATRNAIWADIEAVIKDLRVRQHMMSLDLLRIGAKGVNPLKLDCWITEEEIDSEGQKALKRNPKGMALLGHDSAAYDGYIALRQWHSQYQAAMLQGNDMWDSVPYTKSHIQAIAALSRVFEF